ncbi:beta-galactosidase [Paraglaciecola aquimarina]|uniref:Beta-galactosidase n=1 Tax=Paraglaciecola algarum TaxID=3050085 RepID=A0ABS9DBQ3_9ALTE|nr:beta-galactosidase [Paraglaciecola sp. G1-23]MCF2950271.1 beta-galactosidase [Paraglaciecola sp. G1-23]
MIYCYKKARYVLLGAVSTSLLLTACSEPQSIDKQVSIPAVESKDILSLLDFETPEQLSNIKLENVQPVFVNSENGVTQGKQGLRLNIQAKDNYKTSFSFAPKNSWDWSAYGPFKVALDIANPETISAQIYVTVADGKGQTHNRSVIVPKQSNGTYTIELAGGDLGLETGIRSNPKSVDDSSIPVTWRWGVKQLDLTQVKSIKFSMTSLLHDRALVIDNLRLIEGNDYSLDNLTAVVDEFGQNINVDFPIKVNSLEQLLANKAEEEKHLDGTLMADRSKFGGWKEGPKLEGTGYFRTTKIEGQWSLVDPEGYLFFSHGIANVRMSNTSTITGYDFDKSLIKQRDKNDLTPEDSKGLNTISGPAIQTRHVSSSLRSNMFTWLPSYDDPLANHFGYRRSVHTGAVEHGETFSFYRANLERKYGESSPESFMDDWQQTTLNRMNNWGFTSFGNWIDPSFYAQQQVPYFANGWIIGPFKTVSSGNDYWSPLPDPFDPVFVERARVTAEAIAQEVNRNPWCVGVFIDNEKSWGTTSSVSGQYGVVINTLSLTDAESPTKAQFTQLLKDKYQDIVSFNKAWGTHFEVWQELSNGILVTEHSAAMIDDYSMLLHHYASQYFSVVKAELKRVLPNHLYMGVRFADWGMTPEVVRAAADHVDVVSYNYYKEGLQKDYWKFLEELDMPSIIGEFHIGATDTGLFNPGLVHAEDQADRGRMYQDYMHSVIDNPYFVGAHWFQYIDSPLTGRAYDGENYNVGFVSVTDTPYTEMVEAAKKLNTSIYPRKFKDLKSD